MCQFARSTQVTISMSGVVRIESACGLYGVVIIHQQQSVVGVLRLVVVAERERVPGFSHAVVVTARSAARRISTLAGMPSV